MTETVGFAEPWEARAFALVRTLRDRGVVSAGEWTDALIAAVGRDGATEVQYRHWLAALEDVLIVKGLVSDDALVRFRAAWSHAAHRTPHGQPILLTDNDFPHQISSHGACSTC